MQRATPENKDFLTPEETIVLFVLNRRKFGEWLTKAIEELTKEKTIIMIAHRLKTVEHADQIVVIDGGKIVQQGKHNELMKQDGIYRTFVTDRQKAASWKL